MAASKPYRRQRANGTGTAYKRGSTWTASYTYDWTVDGKPRKRTKGGFRTKREALDYIPALKAVSTPPPSDLVTLYEVFTKWVPYYSDRITPVTMSGMKAAMRWLEPVQDTPISKLTIDELQDAVDACPRGKRTRENIKYLLGCLYRYAMARRLTDADIAQYIYCGKENARTREPFTAGQIERIRLAIGDFFGAEYVYCLIYTGFRPNEMLSLKREAYDPRERTLTGGFKTEAGTNRIITLSPKIAPIVRDLAARAQPFIFPDRKGRMYTDHTFRNEIFYPLLDYLSIQPLPDKDHPAKYVPYSCRHTFAQLMKNAAGSDTDKAGLMGHAHPSMTKYYQAPDLESKRRITDQL